jgi:EF hand
MNTFPIAKPAARNLSRLIAGGLLVLGLTAGGVLEGTALAGQPADGAQQGQQTHGKHGHHRAMSPAAMVERFDANRDGKLAVAELPKKMQKRLDTADTNKDGFLSVDEIKAKREQHAMARFAKRDTNGDGALSEPEVGARGWAHLKVADSNNDARVTFAELREARAAGKMKGAHGGHARARKGGA